MDRISTENLISELVRPDNSIIAVDGFLGAGKSTLAGRIGSSLGYNCVHLDDFLDPHKGAFLENLDFERLKIALSVTPFVIEGVCVLAVLERLGLKPDILIFVVGKRPANLNANPDLVREVGNYMSNFDPRIKADYVINMNSDNERFQVQVDIAYINAKTRLAVVLAVGGILAIFVGAIVFVLGAQGTDTTTLRIAGLEVSATGLGAVIMATSSVWGYLAFLARPKFARRNELKRTENPDGSIETHEIDSSTMIATAPERPDRS